ncbi:hypothetical protein QJQ45_013530, partial [Haematococcus lacustris]
SLNTSMELSHLAATSHAPFALHTHPGPPHRATGPQQQQLQQGREKGGAGRDGGGAWGDMAYGDFEGRPFASGHPAYRSLAPVSTDQHLTSSSAYGRLPAAYPSTSTSGTDSWQPDHAARPSSHHDLATSPASSYPAAAGGRQALSRAGTREMAPGRNRSSQVASVLGNAGQLASAAAPALASWPDRPHQLDPSHTGSWQGQARGAGGFQHDQGLEEELYSRDHSSPRARPRPEIQPQYLSHSSPVQAWQLRASLPTNTLPAQGQAPGGWGGWQQEQGQGRGAHLALQPAPAADSPQARRAGDAAPGTLRSTQDGAHRPGLDVPFGTTRTLQEQVARSQAMEDHLIKLCAEKSKLEAEFAKLPSHGRNGRDRARKVEVEGRLEELNRDISTLRLALKKLQPNVHHATLRLRTSNPGQQDVGDEGHAFKDAIAQRRQVIKAALRGLVEAARPDLSTARIDAVVAEINKRMTMGSKQCCLTACLCSIALAQLPPLVQLDIWDPKLLAQIKGALDMLSTASVLEHMTRQHRHPMLMPVFEDPSNQALLAKLQDLGNINLTDDANTIDAHSMQLAVASDGGD